MSLYLRQEKVINLSFFLKKDGCIVETRFIASQKFETKDRENRFFVETRFIASQKFETKDRENRFFVETRFIASQKFETRDGENYFYCRDAIYRVST